MIVRRKFPRDVIVGRFSIFRIMLRRKQIYCVIAVRLVEANHIRPGGKGTFANYDWLLGSTHFDLLAHEPCHHLCYAIWVTLIFRNHKRVRWLREALLPGIPPFFIEVAKQFFGMSGCVVESSQSAGFLIVEIVASGPGDLWRSRHGTVPLHGCGGS